MREVAKMSVTYRYNASVQKYYSLQKQKPYNTTFFIVLNGSKSSGFKTKKWKDFKNVTIKNIIVRQNWISVEHFNVNQDGVKGMYYSDHKFNNVFQLTSTPLLSIEKMNEIVKSLSEECLDRKEWEMEFFRQCGINQDEKIKFIHCLVL